MHDDDNLTETITHNGSTIKIYYDTDPSDPREWDNLGHMACWHRRYNLGDKDQRQQFSDPSDFRQWLDEQRKARNLAAIFPIYGYDHGGLTISTGRGYPFNDRWDSGQLGYIYVTKEDVRKNWNTKRVTKKLIQRSEEILLSEIQTYDDYLTGQVYGIVVQGPGEDQQESCWGFYGSKDAETEAKRMADYYAQEYAARIRAPLDLDTEETLIEA